MKRPQVIPHPSPEPPIPLGLPLRDLDMIFQLTQPYWQALHGKNLFITGGTGFFGRWLLESFLHANRSLSLGAGVTVLTRSPRSFAENAPTLARDPAVTLLQGNVESFAFPKGEFSHVIHAATDSSAQLNEEHPLRMIDTIVAGTRRTLDLARQGQSKRFLLVSSGAVYGAQPPDLVRIPENFRGGPALENPGSAYGEAKRVAELMGTLCSGREGLDLTIARCFSFVGPGLPLDRHFAVGNFLRDALAGKTIEIKGDGTPVRSYLYAADLAVWLWTLLFRGAPGRAYNVGSEQVFSIAETAQVVAECFSPHTPVKINSQSTPGFSSQRYVPSTERAQQELNLREMVALPEALRRTLDWHRSGKA